MTAQTPERIIIDGKVYPLFKEPLYRLLTSRRMDLDRSGHYCTNNYRGYIGTWGLEQGRLVLLHINWEGSFGDNVFGEVPLPPETLAKLLRAIPCRRLPVEAHWFSGVLRIAIGQRLVYSHHGWSNWYKRERVVRIVHGRIVRDREVDTEKILRWYVRRNPGRGWLIGEGRSPSLVLAWPEKNVEEDDWAADWWPPDYPRPGHADVTV